jgi:HEAT repeat protein
LIKDEDHSVRRRAVVSLVKIGGDQCTQTLVDLFTSKEFGLLSHDCKLSMLVVIRNLSSAGQRRAIQAVFGMKALFKKKPLEDTKLSLIEIMHLMNQEVASEMLGKMIAKSSGKLRKAAEAALEKVNRADKTH